MVNQDLKRELLRRLGITESALSKRVSKVLATLSMEKEYAYYIVAHTAGIKLNKYLSADAFARFNELQNKWAVTGQKSYAHPRPKAPGKIPAARTVSIKVDGRLLGREPLLQPASVDEAKKMATIFPILYVLENSVRLFLARAMEHYYGKDWWESDHAVKPELRLKVDKRKKDEKKHPWHQKRASSNIAYLDFNDLIPLVTKLDERLCKRGVLPKRNWLRDMIEEVYLSRCVLCHMNPLQSESVKAIEVLYSKWAAQIDSTKELLSSPRVR